MKGSERLLADATDFAKLRLSFAKFSCVACLLPVGHEEVVAGSAQPGTAMPPGIGDQKVATVRRRTQVPCHG